MYKVLIADDSKYAKLLVKESLEGCECEIVGNASNGEEAYKMYLELNPDLSLLDITMEGMDGLEVMKKIKEDNPDAKVVLVTARAELIAEGMADGASNFITKPYDVNDLREIIMKTLEG